MIFNKMMKIFFFVLCADSFFTSHIDVLHRQFIFFSSIFTVTSCWITDVVVNNKKKDWKLRELIWYISFFFVDVFQIVLYFNTFWKMLQKCKIILWYFLINCTIRQIKNDLKLCNVVGLIHGEKNLCVGLMNFPKKMHCCNYNEHCWENNVK